MKKTKKIAALILAGVLTFSLSGCMKNLVLDGDGMVNSEPSPAVSEIASEPASEPVSETGWEKPSDTEEKEKTGKASVELPYVQNGYAVYYDGQILYREYSSNSVTEDSLFGEFSFNGYCYQPGKLNAFDPENPEEKPKTVTEDSGFGTLYLVGNDLLYSQECADYMKDEGAPENFVYKRNLKSGEYTKLSDGVIAGFSPDGKHYATDYYATNPYLQHYVIYSTDDDKEAAHYTSDSTLFFLGMDDENAYLLKECEGMNEDNTPVYQVIRFGFDGSEYCLAECDFHSVSEYFYPSYDNDITITDDSISFRVDFYEGTSHFYSGSIKTDVSKANDADPSDEPIGEAKMEFFTEEDDPQATVPPSLEERKSEYADYESGKAFGKILQYHTPLADGTFYTVAECIRNPFGDIGWRECYRLSNLNYYFIPADSDEPVLLGKMYPKLGERGNLEKYEYYEMQPDIMVKCGFLKGENDEYVGVYYEPVFVDGPESPIEESGYYYIAELADDIYYEHPHDDDIYEPFDVDGLDALTEYINSWDPSGNKPVKDAEYDYEGNLVSGEQDYSIKEGDGVCLLHLVFDENGDVYYLRPVIMD